MNRILNSVGVRVIVGALLLASVFGLGLVLRRASTSSSERSTVSEVQPADGAVWPARAREESEQTVLGEALYERECAACHGMKAEGQPNWAQPLPDGSLPAPPHDVSGHTWHHSDAELIRIIMEGGTVYDPNSNMPAFGEKLASEEAEAILAYIKTYWGPRELSYQAEQTWNWEEAQEQLVPTPPDAMDKFQPSIVVSSAWARPADAGRNSAGYLAIENTADTTDRLTGVSAAGVASALLHETRMDGDIVRMVPLANGIEVPARGTVTLEPGAMHIILVDLESALREGDSLELTLFFETFGRLTVEAIVAESGK